MQNCVSLSDTATMDLPIALMEIEPGGRIIFANRRSIELMNQTCLAGRNLDELLEGPGRPTKDWLNDALNGRGLCRTETLRRKNERGEVYVQVTLSKHRENLLAVLSDATMLKSLEAQLVQSRKMQAVGQLAGGVAHDFNNLLTAISGSCELLYARCHTSNDILADLNDIRANVERAALLVKQLMAFSRKQPLCSSVFQVGTMITECAELLSKMAGAERVFTITLEEELPLIRADKMQLERVLMNLIVNARQSTREGGLIELSAKSIELTSKVCKQSVELPAGRYVCLRVTDDGSGIPPDVMPNLFEPFFTTKPVGEGTGLGLSMAYGFVKQSGGFIFADNAAEGGAVFEVLLPQTLENEDLIASQKPIPSVSTNSTAKLRVLLVDDEESVRNVAARALRLSGYEVLEADSAESALAVAKDDSQAIDLFLSDVVMPGGDGPSWVKKARAIRPNAKVIFMSGYAKDLLDETSASLADAAFLPKPYSITQLTELVRAQLEETLL